jgi:uncharacterized HAD superfamily protein
MRIAIDLDNTLIKFNIFWFNKLERFGYKLCNHTRWDLQNYSEDFSIESIKLFQDFDFLKNIPLYEGVYSKLLEWHNKNYVLEIITSRNIKLKEFTIDFVKSKMPMISKVVIPDTYDKVDSLINGNYDVIIDDNPLSIESALYAKIKNIYMISNMDTVYTYPYINEFKEKNVKIVSSINDILI